MWPCEEIVSEAMLVTDSRGCDGDVLDYVQGVTECWIQRTVGGLESSTCSWYRIVASVEHSVG